VPAQLLKVIYSILCKSPGLTEDLDCCEFFAGKRAITNSLTTLGYRTVAYDICDGNEHDWNTDAGFCKGRVH